MKHMSNVFLIETCLLMKLK